MNPRRVLVLAGTVVALFGLVWLMQGIGIIQGSLMTGSQFWAIVGGLVFLCGVGIVAVGFGLWKRRN